MFSQLTDKLITEIKKLDSLDDNEFEFHFASFDKFFNQNIGKDNFEKIHTKYINNKKRINNEIIVDWHFKDVISKKLKLDRKSNFVQRMTFNENINIFEDINFNDYDFRTTDKKYKTQYLLKENVSRTTIDNIRLSHKIEHDIEIEGDDKELVNITNNPFSLIRFKNRVSRNLDKYFRLDMTITKYIDIDEQGFLIMKDEIDYSIELELIKLPKKLDMHIELIENSANKHVKNIFFLYSDLDKLMFSMNPMNPATMEKKDIVKLQRFKYTVTDKADGIRVFIVFLNGKVTLINPKTKEIIKEYSDIITNNYTVIDGEYLEETNEFLGFDLLYSKKIDFRNKFLDERLKELKQIVNEDLQNKISDLNIKVKTFYFDNIFEKSKELWNNRKDLFTYNLDGLIYTPVNQYYTTEPVLTTLKWKEFLSIDVRVEYNKRQDFTYFHHSSANNKSREWNVRIPNRLQNDVDYIDVLEKDIKYLRWTTNKPGLMSQIKNSGFNLGTVTNGRFNIGIEGIPNTGSDIRTIWSKYDIVEYEFNTELNQWVALRIRTFDKEKPNAYRTIESVLNAIVNHVSIDDISKLEMLEEQDNVGDLYNLTKDETKKRANWRKFHNFVKGELINNAIDKNDKVYVMDLACGKGGDLQKWMKNGATDILAIDSSYVELYGENGYESRLLGLGFAKNDYFYSNGKMNVTIVWGDISKNVKNGESALNDEEREKLQKFFNHLSYDWKGFDIISIMFAIHYMFGDSNDNDIWFRNDNKINSFMTNINELLSINGKFIGTYLNGYNMDEEEMKFIKNKQIFYYIKNMGALNEKYIDTILIRNEVWGDVSITEPKINNDVLNEKANEFYLTSIKKKNDFKGYYKNFTKKLEKDEKRLSFINNTFMFSFSDEEKLNRTIYTFEEKHTKKQYLEHLKSLKINYKKLDLDKLTEARLQELSKGLKIKRDILIEKLS
jgi:hypothetical protein